MNVKALIPLVAAIALIGCVPTEETTPVVQDVETQQQAVSVTPTYSIVGMGDLPQALHLSQIGFGVSEIRLEPIDGSQSSVAYSAVRSEFVTFDVANGEQHKAGTAIELPDAGRYLVSLRFEPVERSRTSDASSFVMSGFVDQESARINPLADDGNNDRPTPLPFSPDEGGGEPEPDEPGDPVEDSAEDDAELLGLSGESWTPFHYQSERAVFFPLGEVEFVHGEQQLDFSFDVRDWAANVVEPIAQAVEIDQAITDPTANQGVDISRYLDSNGHGAESFVEKARVKAMPTLMP